MKHDGKCLCLISIIILFFVLESCDNQDKKRIETGNEVTLVPTGEILKLPIDNNTTLDCMAMFYFRDRETGKEYLTYLNSYKNEIHFYDLKLQKLESKVTCALEGPNGVGKVSGFKVINRDSIFLTLGYSIVLIDSKGQIIDKFSYKETKNGNLPIPYFSTSRVYWPLVVKSKILYIPQELSFDLPYMLNDAIWPSPNSKVCLIVNMINKKNEYLPMKHPLANEVGLNTVHFSREFDGNYFIYSFFDDPNVYVTRDHTHVEEYYAPSIYFDKIVHLKYKSMPSFEKYNIDHITRSSYHNIIYDTKRKVYYRFVKLLDKYEKGDDMMRLVKYPRNFSIIVLNKDFQVIGETKLPPGTYEYKNFFVAEKGLYLSINHIDNPNLDINALQFELIKLEYNEN